jgi:hypothetical protein
MTLAILVAPKFDEPTSYSYEWSREIKEMLEEKGFQVVDISGRAVSREEVEQFLRQNPKVIYIHYNHGNTDCHYGSETVKVVDLKNAVLLSGREVYCMNCLSARELGVEAYKNGALAYWGYVEVFAFSTEALDEFKEFANAGLKYKLEGHTWEECLKLVKELAEQLCQKLVEAGKYMASILLKQDADALRCYTPNNPPTETKCIFRKVALKIFGHKLGWKINRRHALALITFWCGWGLAVHDFFVECATPLRFPPHGFWFGVALITLSFFIATYDYVKWLKR